MKLKEKQTVYVRSMGKVLEVSAIFDNDSDANKYMEKHHDEGVIAVFGNYVFIAEMYQPGLRVN